MKKIKNNKKTNNNKSDITYSMELKKLFIIISVILGIFLILYLIIGIFVTKDIKLFGSKDNNNEITSTIQYKEILAGETFNMKNDEYYVIFSDSTKNYYSIYNTIIESKTDKHIYLVDTSNPLNKLFISEESNPNAQKASDLKVKDNTLIKINNKNNIQYIEGSNEILTYFK